MSLKVYCCYPISGMSYDDVITYYSNVKQELSSFGYKVFNPMTGKESLRNELEFRAHGYTDIPVATNHAILRRDRWMVNQSDIVFANFLDAKKRVSIGSVMELAMAYNYNKHTIVCMDEENIHQHAFVLECADVVFKTYDEAINYLAEYSKFNKGYK